MGRAVAEPGASDGEPDGEPEAEAHSLAAPETVGAGPVGVAEVLTVRDELADGDGVRDTELDAESEGD